MQAYFTTDMRESQMHDKFKTATFYCMTWDVNVSVFCVGQPCCVNVLCVFAYTFKIQSTHLLCVTCSLLLFEYTDLGGYGSDVTCSFPANGTFTKQQKQVFEGVLNAQKAVYKMLQPGVSWVDCHKAAEAAILEALVEIGIVVLPNDKSIKELVEIRLGAVFMPHGLGHFVGIDTHDVGGYLPGHPERSNLPGLKSLRTARNMLEGMTVTVEPGCYFIDHLLDEALKETLPFKQYLNEELLQEFRGFGGVRLEDVVAVTKDGCVNYTLCPRTISEIEHVMANGKWPPLKDEAPELLRVRLTDPTPLPSPPSL